MKYKHDKKGYGISYWKRIMSLILVAVLWVTASNYTMAVEPETGEAQINMASQEGAGGADENPAPDTGEESPVPTAEPMVTPEAAPETSPGAEPSGDPQVLPTPEPTPVSTPEPSMPSEGDGTGFRRKWPERAANAGTDAYAGNAVGTVRGC